METEFRKEKRNVMTGTNKMEMAVIKNAMLKKDGPATLSAV